jgi:hypothetical protein
VSDIDLKAIDWQLTVLRERYSDSPIDEEWAAAALDVAGQLRAEVQRHRIAEAQLRVLCEVSAFGGAALMRLADADPSDTAPVLCVAVVDVLHQLDREAS